MFSTMEGPSGKLCVNINAMQCYTVDSDDRWDYLDAQVVCSMLGFSSYGAMATSFSTYGTVSDDFIMDDVRITLISY